MRAPVALALCLLAAPLAARADDARPRDPGEVPLSVEIGKTEMLGPGKQSPVRCDDLDVVEVVANDEGLGLHGLKLGSTLCSVNTGVQRPLLYRVSVVPPPPPKSPAKKPAPSTRPPQGAPADGPHD